MEIGLGVYRVSPNIMVFILTVTEVSLTELRHSKAVYKVYHETHQNIFQHYLGNSVLPIDKCLIEKRLFSQWLAKVVGLDLRRKDNY